MSVTLEDFKKAYDKKGAALDYEKYQGMLDSMAPIPDRQEALAYVKSKSPADHDTLVTKFGQTPMPTAPPAGRRRGKKTAKKTKSKRKTRKASKSRRR